MFHVMIKSSKGCFYRQVNSIKTTSLEYTSPLVESRSWHVVRKMAGCGDISCGGMTESSVGADSVGDQWGVSLPPAGGALIHLSFYAYLFFPSGWFFILYIKRFFSLDVLCLEGSLHKFHLSSLSIFVQLPFLPFVAPFFPPDLDLCISFISWLKCNSPAPPFILSLLLNYEFST